MILPFHKPGDNCCGEWFCWGEFEIDYKLKGTEMCELGELG